jgi:hypothetical protein
MLEFQGIESARRLFAAVVFGPGRTYRVVPTHANGQPAVGAARDGIRTARSVVDGHPHDPAVDPWR